MRCYRFYHFNARPRHTYNVAKINDKIDAIIARQKTIFCLIGFTFGMVSGSVFDPAIRRAT